MKAFIILLTTLGLATAVWAGNHGGKFEGKRHFGKMMFEKMDADGDSIITGQEHEASIQHMVKKRRERFTKMDADGDGVVTKEEARKEMGRKEFKKQQKGS